MGLIMARTGAVLYILWGLLHLMAAKSVWGLGATLEPGMVQARIYQDAFYLGFFAVAAIAVAGAMNWRNSLTGYWINAIAVTAADIPFILFILAPGHAPLVPGIAGPSLWLLALAASTAGVLMRAKE